MKIKIDYALPYAASNILKAATGVNSRRWSSLCSAVANGEWDDAEKSAAIVAANTHGKACRGEVVPREQRHNKNSIEINFAKFIVVLVRQRGLISVLVNEC